MFQKITAFVFLLALTVGLAASAGSSSAKGSIVEINLLSFAAWTGEVDPLSTDAGPAGGAATLAAYWRNERAANPNTLLLGTGNSFGTSPPISNLYGQ